MKYTGTGDPLAWAQQQDQAKLDKSTTSPWLGDGTTRGLADKLASKATTTVTSTLSNENKQATFTLDSPGLWLIVDQAVTGKSSKALPILAGTKLTINNTVYSSGSIDMKNQTASVSKTVTDQTVAAGQDASYTITTKVPNYVGYKVNGYQFTVSDKFAHNAPLSYKTDTLKVTVDNKQLTAGTDYTVTGFNSTSKTFIIDLSAYIKAKGFKGTPVDDSKFTDADLVGKNVTVEYKATVTGSTGNTGVANTPTIRYPNDPSNNESKQEVPGTPVKVFNFDYTLVKKDKTTGAALEGAKFAIKNADGKYLAYTRDQDGNGKWITLDTKPESTADGTLSGVFTTDPNGKVTFTALDEGKYTIEEIAAPNGYVNVGVSFSFTIAAKPLRHRRGPDRETVLHDRRRWRQQRSLGTGLRRQHRRSGRGEREEHHPAAAHRRRGHRAVHRGRSPPDRRRCDRRRQVPQGEHHRLNGLTDAPALRVLLPQGDVRPRGRHPMETAMGCRPLPHMSSHAERNGDEKGVHS